MFKFFIQKTLYGGWMDGWWVSGWMEAKAGLRIAYRNQKNFSTFRWTEEQWATDYLQKFTFHMIRIVLRLASLSNLFFTMRC